MLSDKSRRLLVNTVVVIMIHTHGKNPKKETKISFAKAIVGIFPNLKDPGTSEGYETFYDPDTRLGYLAWRLRTVIRTEPTVGKKKVKKDLPKPDSNNINNEVTDEEVQQIIIFLQNACPDQKDQIFENMKKTFFYRRNMIIMQKNESIFTKFPRFLDTPGLIRADFELLYPIIKSSIKTYIQEQSEKITYIFSLTTSSGKSLPPGDLTHSVLRLIVFHKSADPLNTVPKTSDQPHIVAVGTSKSSIASYFLRIDNYFIPIHDCIDDTNNIFDVLFQCHFVFHTQYDQCIDQFWKFVESEVYGINDTIIYTQKMRELRSRLQC